MHFFTLNISFMTKIFNKINPEKITDNPFTLMNSDWMLITAGTKESFNTMTAAWGGLGVLWHRNIAVCFVRPTRHTFGFIEQSEFFTLTFFSEEHRHILNFCGKKSGRDTDKITETGLIPIESEHGGIYFEQARLVLECRKIYTDNIKPEMFLESSIHDAYPLKDYHTMYIGEIINCLVSK